MMITPLPDKHALAFRERQRRTSLEARAIHKKKEVKTEEIIPVQPLIQMPIISVVKLQDYSRVSDYIGKVIDTREHIRDPVINIIINLFLNLPNQIYAPGKNYSGAERECTKKQLAIFQDSLKVMELLFDYQYVQGYDIGNFKNKFILQSKELGELIKSGAWEGKEEYHILHIRNPSAILRGLDPEEMATDLVKKKHPDETGELENYSPEIRGNKELEYLAEMLDREWKGLLDENGAIIKAIEKFINEHANLTYLQKDFLAKLSHMLSLKDKLEREIEQESVRLAADLPDEKRLVLKLSNNLTNNGVLILESSGLRDIPGLKCIASYEFASLYQKNSSSISDSGG